MCCGIDEIADIADHDNPKEALKEVCHEIYYNDKTCAFMMFSDIGKKESGKALHKYITKNKLGTVTKSVSRINPNSDNSLAIWIWAMHRGNLKKWWNKNKSPNE